MKPKAFEQERTAELLQGIRSEILGRLDLVAERVGGTLEVGKLLSGKMLRSRLAGRLAVAGGRGGEISDLCVACAAVELAHTASLCHDDVIDNALLRRARPALWRELGASGAVLIGDLILCEATTLIAELNGGCHLRGFLAKLCEVVAAEAQQELVWRGRSVDSRKCLSLARGKTGPLFAFAAGLCGGGDEALSTSLEQAGYSIGTAYQLADDLQDVCGDEDTAGKTLGTDGLRRKYTLAHGDGCARRMVRDHVRRLCEEAVGVVSAWPEVRSAVELFIVEDLQPVLLGMDRGLAMKEVV